MSAAFVPLVPGSLPSAAAASTRLKPIPATTAPAGFEPANPAKPQPEPPLVNGASNVQHGPPKVTLERQGETITHIRVECGCGQVTELKCDY